MSVTVRLPALVIVIANVEPSLVVGYCSTSINRSTTTDSTTNGVSARVFCSRMRTVYSISGAKDMSSLPIV